MNWETLRAFIDGNRDFLVTTHVRTDGDGLGSELALAGLIRAADKSVRIVNPSPVPPRYAFLDPDGLAQQYRAETAADLLRPDTAVLVVDTNAWSQLDCMADFIKAHSGPRMCIDHHVKQGNIGGELLVDPTAEATGVLVLEALEALGARIDEATARALFVAVATDTGWFRFSNVLPRTYEAAARLMRRGANPTELYARLYESNRPEALKLRARLLASLAMAEDGQVCHGMIAGNDFRETGAMRSETEDLVNVTLTIGGVELGLLFVELPDGTTKVSFRSRRQIDCNALARQVGGGGHVRASGASLAQPPHEARERVLQLVHEVLPPTTQH